MQTGRIATSKCMVPLQLQPGLWSVRPAVASGLYSWLEGSRLDEQVPRLDIGTNCVPWEGLPVLHICVVLYAQSVIRHTASESKVEIR
jgi:hypothetical protein